MNKIIRLSISIFWLVLMICPLIVIICKIKYPAIDYYKFGYIIIPISVISPIAALLYSIFSFKIKKSNKLIDSVIVVGLVVGVIYTFICTFGFRACTNVFYPLCSSTKNINNYLVIDDNLAESELKYINSVFPNEIPDNASNIKYYYYCNGLSDYKLMAEWKLPYEDYVDLKSKFSTKRNLIIEENYMKYNYSFDDDMYKAKIEFDDTEYLVKYNFTSIQ